MSRFSILSKSLGVQSIKQIVNLSQRHITTTQCATAIVPARTVCRQFIKPYGIIRCTFRHVDDIGQWLGSYRALHVHHLLCNDKSTNETAPTKTTSVDQFRAEEERIEREYQQQHQEQQQKQDELNRAEQQATDDLDGRDAAKIQATRTQILDAALVFVKTHGWSREAITRGAEVAGYPGIVHGLFPNGAIELIQHFIATSNAALIAQLTAETQASPETVPSPREFILRAIRLRLEMIIPYKEHWPQAIALMTLPQNVQVSLAHMLTLVDDICYCAGDRSVSIDWYTRRVGVASIYKMTELHLLQDQSIDYAATWTFLERRMDEGLQIQEFLSASDQKAQLVVKTVGSAFETARNILGINSDKR